jgi:hypothetical protein
MTKSEFDQLTSMEKYKEILISEHIWQSQNLDNTSNYQKVYGLID